MTIADKLDRKEETFSSEFSQNMKGKSLTHSLQYIFATEVAKFEFSLEIYLSIRY